MLEINNLTAISAEGNRILDHVSLSLRRDERVCLTGASGAGKSTLIRIITGVGGRCLSVTEGDILLNGKSIFSLSDTGRRELCGKTFGLIPQNAMTAFFQNITIGKQLVETYRFRLLLSKPKALTLAEEMLRLVNLQDTKRVMHAYPGQLSGGMLQRVAMSVILGLKPAYILADEPTSALDPHNREMLIRLLSEYHDGGILLISHDVEAMKELCPLTCVIEHGKIIEEQKTENLFASPQQEWTRKFVKAANRNREDSARWKRLW